MSEHSKPPTSWSIEAKRPWPDLPEEVQRDVLEWERDANERIGAAHKEIEAELGIKPKELRKYREQAAARGQTLADFLKFSAEMEDVLRADAQLGFRLLAYTMAQERGVPPEQFQAWAGRMFAEAAQAAMNNSTRH